MFPRAPLHTHTHAHNRDLCSLYVDVRPLHTLARSMQLEVGGSVAAGRGGGKDPKEIQPAELDKMRMALHSGARMFSGTLCLRACPCAWLLLLY